MERKLIYMDSTATARMAAAIKQAVSEQGKTLRSLSLATNIPMTTLHRSMNGARPLNYEELVSIAAELKTTVSALVAVADAAGAAA